MGDRIKQAAADKAEKTRIAAALQKRHAALNIIARDRLETTVEAFKAAGMSPRDAILAVMEGSQQGIAGARNSVFARRLGYEARYVGGMMSEIQRDRPYLVNTLSDKQLSDDVFREMGELREGGKPGVTGNEDAKYLADVFAKHVEASRTDLNSLGASIGKLDGWAGAQVHDDLKMMQAGKEAWSESIAPLLDLNRTFPDVASPEDLKSILFDIYDTIITGVPNKATPREQGQRVNPANLAKSLGKTRVLHFKDAESAIAYRDAFGYGNSIYGIMQHQRKAANLAAQMDMFGPNPELMFNSLVESERRKLRDNPDMVDTDKKKQIDALNATAGPLKGAFDVMSGIISRPGNVTAAKVGNDIRSVQSMAKLGGAVLTAMPTDVVGAAQASMFRGSGFFNGMVKQLDGVFKGRPKGEQAEISYLFGEGFDGIIGDVLSHGLANDGPVGKMSKLTEHFFRWSGLNWWTDVGRSVVGRTVAAEMGMRADTAHADLPANFSHVLGLHGIKEAEWDAIRQAAQREVNGSRYITPDAVRSLPDEVVEPLVKDKITRENIALEARQKRREAFDQRDADWLDARKSKIDEWIAASDARISSIVEQRAAKTGEKTSALLELAKLERERLESMRGDVEKFTFTTGRELGAAQERSRKAIQAYEAKVKRIEASASKTDAALINRDREAFMSRIKELNEFSDKVFSRSQERIDANQKDILQHPERIKKIIEDGKRDLELSLLRYVADETNYAIVETDAASRRIATLGTRPGTFAGEAARFIMQFKGFPIAFTQRVLGRALFGGRGANKWERAMNNTPHLGALMAGLTVAGYMAMTMKDVAKGYWPPRNPLDPKVMIAALTQGGALGIYGDFLFGQQNRFGSGALETFSGPFIGTLSDIINVPLKARSSLEKGERPKMAGDLLNLALNNTPYINLSYARPALDVLFLNSLRNWASPGYVQRQRKQRLKDYGQSSILPSTLSQ
ncbi:hypothetical protein DXT89_14000 [Agrobacterium vitis]|uniref:Uncharacterized protein n=1 Tax=Agrobacterium vitis TaxID=373 RepID=A0A7J4X575_AGRVI|nr:hypothetical protein DXT89_14000 [Agrobacterium vitis]